MKLILAFLFLIFLSGCETPESIDISKPPGSQKKSVDPWTPRNFDLPDRIYPEKKR